MRPMFEIPRLHLAPGAVQALPAELDRLGIQRPLFVTDSGVVRHRVFARVLSELREPTVTVFDRVPENPYFDVADSAVVAYRRLKCDSVVAVGGGSVIDVAKFVAVLAGHGGRTADFAGRSERITAATVPIVAVPTTAGTGSESSPDAGIHPNPHERSTGITSTYVVPRVAICDPELTTTLPPCLTASTAMDALSHCIEGYLAITDCPYADAIALDGIARGWRAMPLVFGNPSDISARREMMLAAFAGGIAIGKGLGPAHAIAITLGDQGLQHGLLSALGVVAMIGAMNRHSPDRVRMVAGAMGLSAGALIEAEVRERMQHLGLPTDLASAGYRLGDVKELARVAEASHFNLSSPYRPDAAEFELMIHSIAGAASRQARSS